MRRWILGIADDLTGALETGAKFAQSGYAAKVTTSLAFDSEPANVYVVDTETRHLTGDAAAAITRALGQAARRHRPGLIYKKTDSTLRGNIAAELQALHEVWPERDIDYQAAYPALGRTVRRGRLMVNGVEVDRTEFASDPLNPVRTSDIRAMLGSLAVNVLDGESDEEVLTCAREVVNAEPLRIAAGPAALAGALAECLGAGTQAPQPWPRLTECLVVNGSRHPSSAAQIEYARAHGVFGDGWSCFEEEVNGEGVDWARQTGQSIRRRLASSPVQALVVFGGDTAFGIHHALGAGTFESIGEIAPGVPLSRCGGMYWITKAGGFGAPDILGLIRDRLS